MDSRARGIMARHLGLQLGLPSEKCSDSLLAAIERAPGGSKILEMLNEVAKMPAPDRVESQSASKNLKAKVSRATHKLQLPERTLNPTAQKASLQKEIKYAAFSSAVAKVLDARSENREAALQHEAAVRSVSTTTSIQEEFKCLNMQSGVETLQTMHRALDESCSKFLGVSSPVALHMKKLTKPEPSGSGVDDEELLKNVQEVIEEREGHRRSKRTAGRVSDKRDNVDAMFQSKIDFRVKKAFDKGVSLRDFAVSSLNDCTPAKLQEATDSIQEALSDRQPSIQACNEQIQAVADGLPQLEERLKQTQSASTTYDAAIKTLRDKVMKDHEKIVKLTKISFNKRLTTAMEGIMTKAKMASYQRALQALEEEEAARISRETAPIIDPATGFEVPFCQWSETELQNKVKTLIVQTHAELTTLLELVSVIRQLAEEVSAVKEGKVSAVISEFRLVFEEFLQRSGEFPALIAGLGWDTGDIFSLPSCVELSKSLAAKEEFLANLTPFIPLTPEPVDWDSLITSRNEMEELLTDRNEVAGDCLKRLTTLMERTLTFHEACAKGAVTEPTEDATPPNSDESVGSLGSLGSLRSLGSFKPRQSAEMQNWGSGPTPSFYSSTPVGANGNASRAGKKLAFDVSTIHPGF